MPHEYEMKHEWIQLDIRHEAHVPVARRKSAHIFKYKNEVTLTGLCAIVYNWNCLKTGYVVQIRLVNCWLVGAVFGPIKGAAGLL